MPNSQRIAVTGLTGLRVSMAELASPEPYQGAGRAAMDRVLHETTAAVEMSTPTGTGDARRPAGSLRDSTRDHSEFANDIYNGIVMQGFEDDRLPYAAYVRFTNLRKRGVDNFGDAVEAMAERWENVVSAPFDEVFARTDEW